MKKLGLILLLHVSYLTFAQTSKDIGEFNSVAVFDKIKATLIESNENKVELSGIGSEDVELINKNGFLKIKMNFKKTLQGDHVKAVVYYQDLNELIADEGATIKVEKTLVSKDLKLNVKKGGILKATVDTDKLIVRGNTGGLSEVKGKTNHQDIVSNSGAIINHKELQAKQSVITVNAGGIVEATGTELVDAKTRAGGTIKIFGSPKELREKNIAGGSVTVVK